MLYKSPEILRNTRTHSDLNTTGGENSIIVRSSGARDHQGAGTVPEDREMGRGAGGGGGYTHSSGDKNRQSRGKKNV